MPSAAQDRVIADRYRLERKIGEGGMGEVYAAQHIYIEKRVAVKLVRRDLVSEELTRRFQQEARAASLIGHENIVSVDDFGRLSDGSVYIAMELLEGESLHDLIRRREPLSLERVLEITRQICRGLDAAHRKGIVHRDIKPENVFLDRRGEREQVKLLDFGIAKFTGPQRSSQPSLTQNGAVFGTPSTMSPEQAMGRPLDARSDLYSCGVILYQMLTGTVPFRADSFVAVLMKHVNEPVEPPRRRAPERDIPPAVEEVVLRALAKNPADRQQSMRELERELEDAVAGRAGRGSAVIGRVRRNLHRRWGMAGRLLAVASVSVAVGLVAVRWGFWPAIRGEGPSPGVVTPQGSDAAVTPAAAGSAPAGETRTVVVDSQPTGAEILKDGRQLGQTPTGLTVPVGAATELVFRKAGWKELRWSIPADAPARVVVSLEPGTPPAPVRHRARPRKSAGEAMQPSDVLLDPYR